MKMKWNSYLLLILLIFTSFNMISCCCCLSKKNPPKELDGYDFSKAIVTGRINLVKKFIESGTDVNELINNKTPLYYALFETGFYEEKNKEIITILIEKGANLNYIEKTSGWSYLHECSRLNYDIMKLLIEKGENVNIEDKNGATPLNCLIYSNIVSNDLYYIDISAYEKTNSFKEFSSKVNLLIEKGAKVNIVEKNGYLLKLGEEVQILDHVVNSALIESYLPELLVSKGADVNYKDKEGRTSLIKVVLFTKKIASSVEPYEGLLKRVDKSIKFLLSKGADINAKDNDNMSALDYAENMPGLPDILKSYGAK